MSFNYVYTSFNVLHEIVRGNQTKKSTLGNILPTGTKLAKIMRVDFRAVAARMILEKN